MSKLLVLICLFLLLAVCSGAIENLSKRVLPINQNCDPRIQPVQCRKGDWIDPSIADCERQGSLTCNAQNKVFNYIYKSWIVDVAKANNCIPVTGLSMDCGAPGTNTRCVCSDPKVLINRCKCQYWPDKDIGTSKPAFCTGYYVGGELKIHHWACCNNCNDSGTDNACNGLSWHGGSTREFCGDCGNNTDSTGMVKYYFNCGSCSLQQECRDYCRGPIINRPGFCWRWLDCFKGCCLQMANQPTGSSKKQNGMQPFCGDGDCGLGESPTTCPIDCCYQVNDACAKNSSNICERECCGSPTCCMEGADDNAASTLFVDHYIIILAIFLVRILI